MTSRSPLEPGSVAANPIESSLIESNLIESGSVAANPTQSNSIRLLWAGFALLYLAFALLLKGVAPTPDEIVHYVQINRFDHGDYRIVEQYLTMLPGYHALVAAILWVSDQRSLAAARLVTAMIGLATIGAFHLLRSRVWPQENDGIATLQFALLPILFPYDFLVYTDALSLALVLAACAATLRRRDVLSGALMIVAMCVRQTNVVWLPLLAIFALAPLRLDALPPPRTLAQKTWPYALGAALFVAYWIWNGHISLSTEQSTMHPDLSAHVGNLYFALFLCAIFLPFQVATGLPGFAHRVASRPWLAILPLLSMAGCMLLFRVDHPFNLATQPLLLHNWVIQFASSNWLLQATFAAIATIAACGLAMTRLRPEGAVLLYPLTAVALGAFWMVEHRYALIPIALWLAFRKAGSRRVEMATTALWFAFAVYFCLGIYFGYFGL